MIEETETKEADKGATWAERIAEAEKTSQSWWDRCKKIKEIYRDKRDGSINAADNKRFNILWSNIQTTSPVLYSRIPIPVVMAKDYIKDQAAGIVSTALKRTLAAELKSYDFDGRIKETVLDYQLTARGTIWVGYEPDFETIETDDPLTGEKTSLEQKTGERAYCIFVNYKDFITNKARTWEEVTWVGRRIKLTRKEAAEEFPDATLVYGDVDRCDYWEIWDKETGQQIFVAPDQLNKIVKSGPVPIEFDDFFPCPKPLFANLDNESIIPTPDYALYQDQAGDLNKYTNRLSRIGDSLKVRGVYSAVNASLANLFEDNNENVLAPTSTPLEGGAKPFEFVPLDIFAQAAAQTADLKNMVKQDIYELTGISDIVRGASDPKETATAQNIKSQWGSLRVKEKQKDVQRFIRDILRLKAEIIAEMFDTKTIAMMSGIQIPPEAENLLRDGVLRNFIIDIETDSTIEPDAQQEKTDRTEFLASLAKYLETALKIGQEAPQLAPMLSELVMFGMKAFPVGNDMEQTIKDALTAMVQAKQQAAQQPPPPDPELLKLGIETQKAQGEASIKQQELQQDGDIAKGEFAIKSAELQLKERELSLKEREMALREQESANSKELEHRRVDAEMYKTKMDAKVKGNPDMVMSDPELNDGNVITPMAKTMQDLGAMLADGLQQIAVMQAEGNKAVIAAVTAPKKTEIVRDKQGRISAGIQTVQ